MSHHEAGPECPLCTEKLTQASPTLSEWYVKYVKPAFPDCHISWSFRNEQDQEQAFRDGKSRAHWPKSAHNHMEDGKPCSRALDLFQINDDNEAVFSMRFYSAVNDMDEKCGHPVRWGGTFRSISDSDHFELT